MLPCPSCSRHVHGGERACPFCAAPLRSTRLPARPAAVLVIAVGSVLSACGPGVSDSGDQVTDTAADPSGSSTTNLGSGSGSTTDLTSSTGIADTVEWSTTDGTVGTTADNDTACDTCGGFYGIRGDFGPPPSCSPRDQDCPRGEHCVPWADDGGDTWNAAHCTPLDLEPDPVGAPCTVEGSGQSGVDSCQSGAMCFFVEPGSQEGVCVELCGPAGDDPECAEGTTCVSMFDDIVPLCMTTCDPKNSACAKTESCEPAIDPMVDVSVCAPA